MSIDTIRAVAVLGAGTMGNGIAHVFARCGYNVILCEIARADFAVEAVPERLDLKLSVLRDADKLLRPEVILASNTSSISVTTLAAATSRPDRFVGVHFMNPVPVMVLIEV